MTEPLAMDDDLKRTWQSLDRRLERQNTLAWMQFKDRRMDHARSRLRPLFWGQLAQLLIGVPVILMAVAVWTANRRVPHLLAAGVIIHAYGVVLIAATGRTLWLITRIDYAAPVVAIQQQLAELRRFYVLSGMIIGLSWWFLWMPFMMVVFAWFGADMYVKAPRVIPIGLASGATGLLLTWWFHRWSRDPRRPDLARAVEASLTGSSLRKAQAALDEVRRFEQE